MSFSPALAVDQLWSINLDNSSVKFEVKNMLVKTVKGEFTNFSGTVNYDGRNLQNATVGAEIVTGSVSTGIPKRDAHIMSNDFLDVAHYPKIFFKSKKIVPDESGKFEIVGTLALHGISKPITLKAEPLKEGVSESGKPKLVTTATTTLNRKDYGINMGWVDQGGVAVADRVKIILNLELNQSG